MTQYLPWAGFAAVVGCLTYVGGYMRHVGIRWISLLDITDVFSLSWPAASFAAIFAFGGLALGNSAGQRVADARSATTWEVSPHPTDVMPILVIGVALLAVQCAVVTPVEYAVLVGAVVAALPIVLLLVAMTRRRKNLPGLLVACGISLLGFCYGTGLAFGSLPFLVRADAQIVLRSGEQVCGGLIAPLRRGVLIAVKPQATIFFQWDDVASIQTGRSCAPLEPSDV